MEWQPISNLGFHANDKKVKILLWIQSMEVARPLNVTLYDLKGRTVHSLYWKNDAEWNPLMH